eukprot:COSAG02_NODE_953_length_15689_cov_112.180564_5_plen_342_part_00
MSTTGRSGLCAETSGIDMFESGLLPRSFAVPRLHQRKLLLNPCPTLTVPGHYIEHIDEHALLLLVEQVSLTILALQQIACVAGIASFEVPEGLDVSPAFAVLDEEHSTPSGLIARLGRGTKSKQNPLFGQTLPWEPRIDNGYANVAYDPQFSKEKPWRLWYDAFTSCNDHDRDDKGRYLHCGGGKRHHSGLYAQSSDGLTWEKTLLDSGVTYKEGVGFCCGLKACECKPGESGAVKTNIYTMMANGNTVFLDDRPGVPAAERYKVVGNNLPANFQPAHGPVHDFGNQGGICASADGLNFTDASCTWLHINNSHWDSWSTMFWDSKNQSFLAVRQNCDPLEC